MTRTTARSIVGLILLLVMPSLARADLYCLSVGVDRYAENKGQKDQYGRDAHAIARLFRTHGARRVWDIRGEHATHTRVHAALHKLAQVSQPNDTVFIFFSDHGSTNRRGKFAMVLRDGGLPGDELADSINLIKGHVVVALDTCGAGGMLRYEVRKDTCIICACRDHEESSGAARKPLHGYFASAVYLALRRGADLQGLCRYVADPRHVRGSQEQHVQIRNTIGNLPLLAIKRPDRAALQTKRLP